MKDAIGNAGISTASEYTDHVSILTVNNKNSERLKTIFRMVGEQLWLYAVLLDKLDRDGKPVQSIRIFEKLN